MLAYPMLDMSAAAAAFPLPHTDGGEDVQVVHNKKRRRGGRRASNPDISAEERKRQRVLKNRESAMRSLAKKAEYSRMLADKHNVAADNVRTAASSLHALLADAAAARRALDRVPSSARLAITARADAAIAAAAVALDGDGEQGKEKLKKQSQEDVDKEEEEEQEQDENVNEEQSGMNNNVVDANDETHSIAEGSG